VEFFELNFEVFDRSGRDANVVCVIKIVVGDDCGGQFVRLVWGFITSAAYNKPSHERFHEDCEEEGG